jgi:hypothetical protein
MMLATLHDAVHAINGSPMCVAWRGGRYLAGATLAAAPAASCSVLASPPRLRASGAAVECPLKTRLFITGKVEAIENPAARYHRSEPRVSLSMYVYLCPPRLGGGVLPAACWCVHEVKIDAQRRSWKCRLTHTWVNSTGKTDRPLLSTRFIAIGHGHSCLNDSNEACPTTAAGVGVEKERLPSFQWTCIEVARRHCSRRTSYPACASRRREGAIPSPAVSPVARG